MRIQIRTPTLDRDADIARIADRAGLIDADPDPVNRKFRQQQQRQVLRQRLDQVVLSGRQPAEYPLGDALVVDGVLDAVAARRARAITRYLQGVSTDGLFL